MEEDNIIYIKLDMCILCKQSVLMKVDKINCINCQKLLDKLNNNEKTNT